MRRRRAGNRFVERFLNVDLLHEVSIEVARQWRLPRDEVFDRHVLHRQSLSDNH
jgi:hypothetical protein